MLRFFAEKIANQNVRQNNSSPLYVMGMVSDGLGVITALSSLGILIAGKGSLEASSIAVLLYTASICSHKVAKELMTIRHEIDHEIEAHYSQSEAVLQESPRLGPHNG